METKEEVDDVLNEFELFEVGQKADQALVENKLSRSKVLHQPKCSSEHLTLTDKHEGRYK